VPDLALMASAVDGPVAAWLAGLVGTSGRDPDLQDVADFEAMVSAVLRHDTTGALVGITRPTLVLGGVHAGGHGVPKQHSGWLQDEVTAFLNAPAEP